MMTKFKKILPLILCCAAFTVSAATAETAAETAKAPLENAAPEYIVYNQVKDALQKHPYRVPGSQDYNDAINELKKIFRDKGIELKTQTYPTLVPEVIKKEFTVNGKAVEFYPLAPNNAALVSTGEKPLEGPLVYISSERLQKNDFGHVDGKIVLLDWGENYYHKVVFPEGAKAIVYVGNDKATQWDVAKILSQYNIAFPCFYINAEEAKNKKLFDSTPATPEKDQPKASILCHTQWKQVQGINLWAEIKGTNVTDNNEKTKPEALFLNARLDSFGTVPGLVSGARQAENLALLAETAVRLNNAKSTLKNSVFVVIYGSSFNAYDGLRFFYYPVFKRKDNSPAIDQYAKGFRQELEDTQKKLQILDTPAPIVREKTEYSDKDYIQIGGLCLGALILVCGLFILALMHKKRTEKVEFNFKRYLTFGCVVTILGMGILLYFYRIFDTSLPPSEEKVLQEKLIKKLDEIKKTNVQDAKYYQLINEYDEIQKELKNGQEDDFELAVRYLLRTAVIKAYNGQNYELADINIKLRKLKVAQQAGATQERAAEIKKLETRKAELDNSKKEVANMRKLINERMISTPAERKLLQKFAEEIKETLKKRQVELQISIAMGDCWNEIAKAVSPYMLRGIYYFDMASSEDKSLFFATRTYEALHYTNSLDESKYKKFFDKFKGILEGMPQTKAKFFTESLTSSNSANLLSSRSLVYMPHAASLPLSETFSTSLRSISDKYDFDEMPDQKQVFDLTAMVPVMTEMFTGLANNITLTPFKDKDDPVYKDGDSSMLTMFDKSTMYDANVNYFYDGNPRGKVFNILSADGKEVDGPAAGALALIMQNEYDRILPIAGFSLVAMGQVNQNGYTTMPLLTGGGRWGQGNFKNHCDSIGFDEFGNVKYMGSQTDKTQLFRAYGGPHFYPYAPLTSNFAGSLSLVNGFTDGRFKNSRTYARVATGDGYAYADTEIKSKLYFDNETFMLGKVTKEQPTGDGITFSPETIKNLNVNRIAIDNTIALNLQRLEKLHSRNIFNSVIELYHDKAEVHKQKAIEAHKEGDLNLARAHEIFGQTLAVQAYRPLKELINDLVKSVLILLILTIPFSFALERLIIGATNIYKQMAWILVFFIGTFLMLYFTHPAFAMSQSPMIIFIAFFIIVMSVMVIYIVMSRFKSELLAMQGMDTSAHRVNSENSMLLAAIMIGVSSMRNRPVKTFLTILTVVLLTFTIISFASFDSTTYVRPVHMGTGTGEKRIESFLPQHVDLLEPLCRSMKELYQDKYHVHFRSASYNSPFYMLPTYPNQANIIYNPNYNEVELDKDEKPVAKPQTIELDAVVGFDPEETLHCEKLGKLMPKLKADTLAKQDGQAVADDGIPGVYLSDVRAKSLGLKVGDTFFLRTIKVRLDGIFDSKDLDDFTYLDNGKVTPPNFNQTAKAEAAGIFAILNSAYVDASNFLWSSPDSTLLTDYETTKKLNGFVNAVIFYPKNESLDIRKDATDIAEVTFGIVYSNTPSHGVERHWMAPVFEASGLSNLLVPLMLGALIILSSLLGSIADREREIFTFSALGLSPKDVSCLFFAESSVYAVIGGLGGYLLSQVTNTVLTALAKRGVLEAPEMNFSSTTTVYTILIVMAIVLLSTVYPAIKAGRAASPDVARKWKMPPPDGDILCFQFPFTVSRVDFGGILVFISEHFGNHADSSLGSFAASNIRITHGKNELTDGYMLTADFTLAPFDLGVAEEMSMYSAPSDIEGIDVVTVRIIRKDGSKGAWLRGNNRFVGEIRNQFLLWRSLPVETVMHYRELAAKNLNTAADAEGEQA